MSVTKRVKFDKGYVVKSDRSGVRKKDKRTKFQKHSLDSDDDDCTGENYEVLNDIEGEEAQTIDFDHDIQITPFNMKDEMEEGHFDKHGTFIFDKTKMIQDNWIDNIDWVHIKESERRMAKERIEEREEAQDEDILPVNRLAVYREMMELLLSQETVAQALCRLGKKKGKVTSTAQSWKCKRLKSNEPVDESEREKMEEDRKCMLRLTEIADSLVQEGMMDIYEASREKVAFLLSQSEKVADVFKVPENVSEDDALDMFAENLDKKSGCHSSSVDKVNRSVDGGNSPSLIRSNNDVSEDNNTDKASGEDKEVKWEYKSSESSQLHGPYSTLQMMQWKESGLLKNGVLCRRVGLQGQFYSSNRVDFDLYLE